MTTSTSCASDEPQLLGVGASRLGVVDDQHLTGGAADRELLAAEARDVLTRALASEPVTIVDLLGTDEGADIEFEPERLGLTARSAQP